MTTRQVAELWGVDESRVRQLCIASRIEGAQKFGHVWMIPTPVKRIPASRGPTGKGTGKQKRPSQ